jgi:arabinoxylan arabinofuranohydrolase
MTNANGIAGYDIYEATYTVPADVTNTPQVSASASNSNVKVDVKQADSKAGTAVVKFDNNGVVKTYRVVLK